MKRLMLVCVIILCMWPIVTLAEQDIASHEFLPAKDENGKWGYVNHEGTVVIPPRYDYAFGFRGNYAEVVVFPENYTGDRNPYYCGHSGIIDRDGYFVLGPFYTISPGYDQGFFGGRDAGIWCITAGEDDNTNQLEGWFDIESGYFSGLIWEGVWGWVSDSKLIPVTDETYRSGYADRTTGELLIPCQYESVDPSCFYGGVASVSRLDENIYITGEGTCSAYFLIDETGKEILLPERIYAVPYEGAHDGLVMVSDQEDVNRYVHSDGALFGFVDTQGNLVIEPQFVAAQHFFEGMAAVQFPEGDWGVIDIIGSVLERGLTEEPDRIFPD